MFLQRFGYCVAGILLHQLIAASATSNTTVSRIVGGIPSTIRDSPYVVKLRYDKFFICAGSLVSRMFVVTAAHCCEGTTAERFLVVGGATKLSELGEQRKVSKVMVHKDYNKHTFTNDVAVLKLDTAMRGKHIETIALYTGALSPGLMVQVFGWGLMGNGVNHHVSNVIRTVKVPVIAMAKCQDMYRGYMRLTNTMFCASVPAKKDAALYDSGGPAVCNGRLCGIVSWGIGSGRSKFPGVYTNVPSVRQFIEKSMQQ